MKKSYLIICLLTTLLAPSVLIAGETWSDGFDRRTGLKSVVEKGFSGQRSRIDNGCVYSSCYGSVRDIIFPFPDKEPGAALNQSLLLKAGPGWSESLEIWKELESCVESGEEIKEEASDNDGFFSCNKDVALRMNAPEAHEWERLTDRRLDAISAEGFFGESFTENPRLSKIILWDEVDGGPDDRAKLAGDLRIR